MSYGLQCWPGNTSQKFAIQKALRIAEAYLNHRFVLNLSRVAEGCFFHWIDNHRLGLVITFGFPQRTAARCDSDFWLELCHSGPNCKSWQSVCYEFQ